MANASPKQSFLRRARDLVSLNFFDVATALAIIFVLVHFGPKLTIDVGHVSPPSLGAKGASAQFSLITTAADFQAALHDALSQSGTVIAIGLPSSFARFSSLRYSNADDSDDIEDRLIAQVNLIEQQLKSIKTPRKPTVLVLSPEAVYKKHKEDVDSHIAYPGAYEARLKSLGALVDLKPVADMPIFDFMIKTQATVICSYRNFADDDSSYINFYYPGVIKTALEAFKTSDPDYLKDEQAIVQQPTQRTIFVTPDLRYRYELPYRDHSVPSDESILKQFWVVTTDPFLQQQLVGNTFMNQANGVSEPHGASQ
jgi:hypothetical protein